MSELADVKRSERDRKRGIAPYSFTHSMTLLDYFAAAALPLAVQAMDDTPRADGVTLGQHIASIAYAIAARMLVERAKAEGK